MSDFHLLKISEVRKETPNSVCITFKIPDELVKEFEYTAGQYVTIKHRHNGSEIRRAYSICSSPGSGKLSIGIKKVKNGAFSPYANVDLKTGDTLEVMPPEGNFVLMPDPSHAWNYLALAAGSGITPVLSIITTALEEEPNSTFSLIYGNQSLEETMFANEIAQLKALYPERFFAEYIFSRRKEDVGLTGRIDRSTVNYLLKNKLVQDEFDAYYLCGPEEMIHSISELLQEKGARKENIHFELFTTTEEGELEEAHEGFTKVTITLDDETETFTMPQDTSVLQASLDHGLDAPYSCQGGICSTCIARITGGKAEMRKNQILTDDEIAEGLILTCQAHPSSPTLSIDYDDV
ncbi:MAG: ferredoxin--NADP reductase [Bacteroidia bacterium]|nr:ferredoxin--NADP reductase [Bacteroidia bacterium]NNF31531.1 ferredoxin--NADP reductase [Flavobacteriaceae bacterium]MBT8275606.1 ferredoxin--NADP reductase [Bacteroidia bacterium]NNJ82796.1 ferredoxin--NADP reductase [Flavobacteriaceae bacterium]NNK54110.1 ferredoxin--NADP reductase [Flavobacteriaceae bacterium]